MESTPVPAKRALTEAELQQRRDAAQHSTGPRTEEGKARSSRNAWKHGLTSSIAQNFRKNGADSIAQLFGKPCVRTCPLHPDNPNRTESPCSLVLDGLTNAGGNCLDKTVYVNAFAALMDAMQEGSLGGMHALMAAEGAASLEILGAIRRAIASHGVMVAVPIVNKAGEALRDEEGELVIGEFRLNPALGAYTAFLRELGISLPEMLATPQSKTRAKVGEDNADAMQTIMGGIMQRVGRPQQPRALQQGQLAEDAE